MSEKSGVLPRREFIKKTAIVASIAAAPAYLTAGCSVEKKEWPAGKLKIAVIGLGMGSANMRNCMDENIVALCDVDERRLKGVLNKLKEDHPDREAPYAFQDYRMMFDQVGDQIDAVIIATPDHTHARITLDAMKLGKHVYCQKPLTHSVYESRMLTRAAKKYDVVTQMGNQGASSGHTGWVCESIWNGDIGEIREVHAWTNRPIWPQCLNRPTEKPSVPSELDWDLWLGPAPERPFSPMYHPWNWRGWWDFGTGALGDMACHILDVVVRSLKLKYPTGIQASSTNWNIESGPLAEKITYYFPERKALKKVDMPEVKVTWYDGGLMPDRPFELEDGEAFGDRDGGVMFVGTKGKIITGCYARNPKMLPADKFVDYTPPQTERRVKHGIGGHEKDWIRACKAKASDRETPKSHFEFAGPFNEMVVMGTVAPRLAGLGRILRWDGENMKFTNIKPDEKLKILKVIRINNDGPVPKYEREWVEVNALEYAENMIKRKTRSGWELEI
ncbi:Gfo/Idh/MocA family oxidoreductase [Puteibacter caeruleilacunae]|nr:Gfo/Idh/MocA family oxidoreductase [Puteibacter caeruleilacunae]